MLNRFPLFIVLVLTTACASAQLVPAGELQGPVPVPEVVDGDTVELPFGNADERVRLVGIDTPEVFEDPEPFGPEASAFTKELLTGRVVYVEIAVEERDRFGRVLAYLYLEDPAGDWQSGRLRLRQVNLEIVRAGWADPLSIPPNIVYADLYVQAAQEAREADRGMW